MPDAFNLRPLREPTATDPLALILGIGVCEPEQNTVMAWSDWHVDVKPSRVTMTTQQEFGSFAADIERTVSVNGRTGPFPYACQKYGSGNASDLLVSAPFLSPSGDRRTVQTEPADLFSRKSGIRTGTEWFYPA